MHRLTRVNAVAAACLTMAGCGIHIGSHDMPSRDQVEQTLLSLPTPQGPTWKQDDTGVGDAFNLTPPDAPTRQPNGLWRHGDDVAVHYVAKVPTGGGDWICDQAAAWVLDAGTVLPSDPPGHSQQWLVRTCLAALDQADPDSSGTDEIEGVGGIEEHVQYGAWLTVRTTGMRADVEVTAMARPASEGGA